MRLENLVEALSLLGIKAAGVRQSYVLAHCPFADWEHARGMDRSASCSFHVNAAGESTYKCFSCKQVGTIRVLAERMAKWDVGVTKDTAAAVAALEASGQGGVVPGMVRSRFAGRHVVDDAGWRDLRAQVKWNQVPRYILDRGVEMATCEAWRIGHDLGDGKARRRPMVTFPLWDEFGAEVGMVGRDLDPSPPPGVPKYWAYPGTRKSTTLYGAHLLDTMPLPRHVVVVEGPFAVLLSWQRHDPWLVLGTMGSDLSPRQAEILRTWADSVVFAYDLDEPGKVGVEAAAAFLSGKEPGLPVSVCRWYPDDKQDPKELDGPGFAEAVAAAQPWRRQGVAPGDAGSSQPGA